MSRNTIVTVLVFALTYLGSFYLRIHVVDTPVGGEGGGAVLAAARQTMLWGQLSGGWGIASLVSGLAALFFGGLATMLAWSVLTAMALCNYNVDLGAIGFVLGVLRLVRFQRPARERSAT